MYLLAISFTVETCKISEIRIFFVQLCEEKKTLEDRAQHLEKNLKEAVQGQLAPARYKIDADTPVEKIMTLLGSMIEVCRYIIKNANKTMREVPFRLYVDTDTHGKS